MNNEMKHSSSQESRAVGGGRGNTAASAFGKGTYWMIRRAHLRIAPAPPAMRKPACLYLPDQPDYWGGSYFLLAKEENERGGRKHGVRIADRTTV